MEEIAEEQIVEDSSSEATEAQEVDDTEASSSDAVETEADLLSVVQDALPTEEAETPQEETEEEVAEVESKEEVEAELEAEDDSEDYSNVPFNKHPRFQKLIAEKNELKEL